MTVIATVISRYAVAHASDSFVTQRLPDGSLIRLEEQETKIVGVNHWRGMMSYWGLAKLGNQRTIDWLRSRAGRAYETNSAEAFANDVANKLNDVLATMHFTNPVEAGIGIHFTAYEQIDTYKIPEQFHITNFSDPSYQNLYESGVQVRRETFASVCGSPNAKPEHREPVYRHVVREWLEEGRILIYNNGDPVMFNQAAPSVFNMIKQIAGRGQLHDPSNPKTHLRMVRFPVQMVVHAQRDFMRDDVRLVGGQIHDLVLTQGGVYDSDSGDLA